MDSNERRKNMPLSKILYTVSTPPGMRRRISDELVQRAHSRRAADPADVLETGAGDCPLDSTRPLFV